MLALKSLQLNKTAKNVAQMHQNDAFNWHKNPAPPSAATINDHFIEHKRPCQFT